MEARKHEIPAVKFLQGDSEKPGPAALRPEHVYVTHPCIRHAPTTRSVMISDGCDWTPIVFAPASTSFAPLFISFGILGVILPSGTFPL